MSQLVGALRYKPDGREFECRWCHWNFSLTQFFRPHYGPGVDSVSIKNECQEYFLGGKGVRCVRLTTLPPLCVDCLEIWEPQTPGNLRYFFLSNICQFGLRSCANICPCVTQYKRTHSFKFQATKFNIMKSGFTTFSPSHINNSTLSYGIK